jgi:hypothetical protein
MGCWVADRAVGESPHAAAAAAAAAARIFVTNSPRMHSWSEIHVVAPQNSMVDAAAPRLAAVAGLHMPRGIVDDTATIGIDRHSVVVVAVPYGTVVDVDGPSCSSRTWTTADWVATGSLRLRLRHYCWSDDANNNSAPMLQQ